MTRMIVLAGAPEPAKLDWSEKALQPSQHIEAAALASTLATSPAGQAFAAQWRQISTEQLQMRPILPKLDISPTTKVQESDTSATEFFSPSDFISQESAGSDVSADESQPCGSSSVESAPEALIEYYDHSFTIHEAVPSSQMSRISEYTPGTPTYESSQDMFPRSDGPAGIIRSPSQRRLSQAPRAQHLSDLDDIPNANYLRSIEPQTMTVNLIVAILSISATRSVTTGRQYGRPRQAELVELTVGDDTKTGFTVTMWLPREMHVNWKDGANATPEGARSLLRRNLKSLRIRDVVLLQNVALSSYRGKVHGQSLKGDVTKIDLLFRKKVDDDDQMGAYSVSNLRNATGKDLQILKVKKVRDWMVEYVGGGEGKGRRKAKGNRRALPDDTQ